MTPDQEEPSALLALLAVALLVASVFVTFYNLPDNPEPICAPSQGK